MKDKDLGLDSIGGVNRTCKFSGTASREYLAFSGISREDLAISQISREDLVFSGAVFSVPNVRVTHSFNNMADEMQSPLRAALKQHGCSDEDIPRVWVALQARFGSHGPLRLEHRSHSRVGFQVGGAVRAPFPQGRTRKCAMTRARTPLHECDRVDCMSLSDLA